MAFIDLVDHPTSHAGQYLDGRTFQWSIPLPVVGADLQSAFLGNVTILEAQTEMDKRKAAFEAHQAESLINPGTWVNIGYVIDVSGLTAYFQYKLPLWKFDSTQLTSWPDLPEVYEDNL